MVMHEDFIEELRSRNVTPLEENASPEWKEIRNRWLEAIKSDREETRAVYAWARERVEVPQEVLEQLPEGITEDMVTRNVRGNSTIMMFISLLMQGLNDANWDGTGHRYYHTTTFQSVLTRMYILDKYQTAQHTASAVEDLIAGLDNPTSEGQ